MPSRETQPRRDRPHKRLRPQNLHPVGELQQRLLQLEIQADIKLERHRTVLVPLHDHLAGMQRLGLDVRSEFRRGLEPDKRLPVALPRNLRHTDHIPEIFLWNEFLVRDESRLRGSGLYGLDSVKRKVDDVVVPLASAEDEPAVAVFLQNVRTEYERFGPRGLGRNDKSEGLAGGRRSPHRAER